MKNKKNLIWIAGLVIVILFIVNGGFKIGREIIPVAQCNRCSTNAAALANDKIICGRDHGFTCSISGGCLTCSGSCTPQTWTPSPSTICSGTTFTQQSNCGTTRSSVGTKDCTGGTSTTCTDSDGGKNYNKMGTVVTKTQEATSSGDDMCYSSTKLEELFCLSDGTGDSELYTCPNGCSNGACISGTEQAQCIDTDGGTDIYTKGWITKSGGVVLTQTQINERTDSCQIGTNNLVEHNCHTFSPYTSYGTTILCTKGCSDGKCLQDNPVTTECETDANCASKAPRTYCNIITNKCVECLNNAHCLSQTKPICSNGVCVASDTTPDGGTTPPAACCDPPNCRVTATKPIVSSGTDSIMAEFTIKNDEACDIDWDLTFFMNTQSINYAMAAITPTPTDCIVGSVRYPAAAIKLKSGDISSVLLKQDGLKPGAYSVTLYSTKDKCTSKLWSAPFKSGENVGPITISGVDCTADYKKCEAGTLKICKTGEKEQSQSCASGKCTQDGVECWIDQSKPCDSYPLEMICGSDGKTYNNTCFIELANAASEEEITVKHLGKCTAEDWSIIFKVILGIILFIVFWWLINKL